MSCAAGVCVCLVCVRWKYIGRISIFQLISMASLCLSCVTKRKAHVGFIDDVAVVTECAAEQHGQRPRTHSLIQIKNNTRGRYTYNPPNRQPDSPINGSTGWTSGGARMRKTGDPESSEKDKVLSDGKYLELRIFRFGLTHMSHAPCSSHAIWHDSQMLAPFGCDYYVIERRNARQTELCSVPVRMFIAHRLWVCVCAWCVRVHRERERTCLSEWVSTAGFRIARKIWFREIRTKVFPQ